jgi:hypothetical protein
MMHRYLLTVLLLLAGAGTWAQESAPADEADAPDAQDTAEEAPDEQEDNLDLDEESYRDAEEEDFVPTEDIPADQAIPFPTDI